MLRLTVLPPRKIADYIVLVPKSGADGNDLGTLLPPEVAVPLATYTGWNLRRRDAGAEGMLASLAGSFLPFPKTKGERLASGDPRVSIEERYPTADAYASAVKKAVDDFVAKRFMLPEDAQPNVQRLLRMWQSATTATR